MENTKEEKEYHGWYSEKQRDVAKKGFAYLTPDGTQIEVSCVTRSNVDHGTLFDDIRYMGKVTKFVRTHYY